MCTKIEPDRKFVAHDEKYIFSIFRPKIPYGERRNVVEFFSRNIFINATKKIKTVNAPGFWKNTQN